MERFIDRRAFLQLGGMSLALTVANPALARRAADRRAPLDLGRRGMQPGGEADQLGTKTLVHVFLRGGMDGLATMPPLESFDHAVYQSYRNTLAVQRTAMETAGTILTDASGVEQDFGLHPRMTELMSLWDQGYLALFPDVHYDAASRSHFDSQQFYDNGDPGNKFNPDGWANRHLGSSPTGDPLLRAIAFDTQTPFALQGGYPTLTFSSLQTLAASNNASRNERFLDAQEAVYPTLLGSPRTFDREVGQAGKDLVAAIRSIEAVSPLPDPDPTAAVIYPTSGNGGVNGRFGYVGDRFESLAKLMKSNAFNIEIAEIDVGGWDTHNQQDASHPDLVELVARCLKAFVLDLEIKCTMS